MAKVQDSDKFMEDKAQDIAPDPGLSFSTLETAGIIEDSAGNKWTIPAKDDTDATYKSIFHIPNPDPRFYYQFEDASTVQQMMGNQFVPVTRKEIGIPEFAPIGEYGHTVDPYHRVGTLVCIKTPKVLEERMRKGLKQVCDAAVIETEPRTASKDEIDKIDAARQGAQYKKGQRRYNLSRTIINATPIHPENESVQGSTEE